MNRLATTLCRVPAVASCSYRTAKFKFPTTFENVIFPPNGEMKLPLLPAEPTYDVARGEQKYKSHKRMADTRGPEEIHTLLNHRQFGLAAISGGFITSDDCKFITDRVNKNLLPKQFAIWRIDAPWLPRTKKAQGQRLGGGKGSISHYVTPVKAGRIILEVGGHITDIEARAFLEYMCDRFAFPVEFVSQELLEERARQEEMLDKHNQNPFNWDRAIRYNMQNVTSWLSPYDIMWRGRYR